MDLIIIKMNYISFFHFKGGRGVVYPLIIHGVNFNEDVREIILGSYHSIINLSHIHRLCVTFFHGLDINHCIG